MRRGSVGLLLLVAAVASSATYAVTRARATSEEERIDALRAFAAWNPDATRGGRLVYYCQPFEDDGSVELDDANWQCSPQAGDTSQGAPIYWLRIVDGRVADFLPSAP